MKKTSLLYYVTSFLLIAGIFTSTGLQAQSDATLSALTVDAGTLAPAFDPGDTTYLLVAPVGTSTVNVTATPNDGNATVTGDGAIDVSSGDATATVTVTSQSGLVTRDYVIMMAVSDNLIEYWDGNGITGAGVSAPNDVGWLATGDDSQPPWNDANAGGGCRFRDDPGGYTYEDGGATVTGRQMMLRWDNGAYDKCVYCYPVALEACKSYTFTWDYVMGGSASPPQQMTLGISTTTDVSGRISSETVTTPSSTTVYRHGTHTFQTIDAGTYYVTLTGAWAWFGINNLSILPNESEVLVVSESMFEFDLVDTVKTFRVAGNVLTEDITLTAPEGITLDSTSITKENAQCGVTVTAKFDGTVTINDKIMIESGTLVDSVEVVAWGPLSVEEGADYFLVHEASDLVMGERAADSLARIYTAHVDSSDQMISITESNKWPLEYIITNGDDRYLTVDIPGRNHWDVWFSQDTLTPSDGNRFALKEFEPGRFNIHPMSKDAWKLLGTNSSPSDGDGIYNDKTGELAVWNFIKAHGSLSGLTVSEGEIWPEFDPDVFVYQLNLPSGTGSVTIEGASGTWTVTNPDEISLSDGDDVIAEVVVTSPLGMVETYTIEIHVASPVEILYLGKGDTYSEAHMSDTANVSALRSAGYSVTYMDRRGIEPFFHDFDQFDYSPYAVLVWGSSVGSSDMKVFAKDNYPIPCLSIKADGPRSDKWGWINKSNSDLWKDAKLSDLIAVPEDRQAGLRMVISDSAHYITEPWNAEDTLVWTTTTLDTLDFENITLAGWDLSDSIPTAIPLISYVGAADMYPTLSNAWAVPAGVTVTSLQMDDSYAQIALPTPVVILSAHSDATPYATAKWDTLMIRSLEWLLTSVDGAIGLKSLTPSVGTLVPDFDHMDLSYDLNLPMGTTSLDLTAEPVLPGLTVDAPTGVTLADGDYQMLDVVVTGFDGVTTTTYQVYVHVATANEVLYLGNNKPFMAKAHISDQANVKALKDAGYSVTYMDRRAIEPFYYEWDQFDYTPYEVIVWGSSVGSSDMKVFAKDNYPLPCVTIKADGPRSDKWGWINKKNSELWADKKLKDVIADSASREAALNYVISDIRHWITEPYDNGEEIDWTTTTADTLDFENITMAGWDLSDSIPEAVALTSYVGMADAYPTLSNSWAIPAGVEVYSLQPDDSYATVTLANPVVILSAHSDATPYQLPVFGTLLDRCVQWVLDPVLLPNDNATLSDLTVDGTTVAGFAANVYTYDVELPVGTTTVPTVAGTAADPNATVVVTPAASLPGSTTVEVTAEDATTVLTYTVSFTVLTPQDDATLSDLQIDGTTVDGFAWNVYTYNEELPAGTTTVPTVTATPATTGATVDITPASALPGSTTVLVTALNGTTTKTYTVNFTVEVGIDPSALSKISIYPNPVHNMLKISNVENSVISIYDLNGTLMKISNNPDDVVLMDVSDLRGGVYILRVQMSEGVYISRIIKQ
jgi:hypothetical protein